MEFRLLSGSGYISVSVSVCFGGGAEAPREGLAIAPARKIVD